MKVVFNTFLKLVITIIVASLALCEWLVFLCVRFLFYIAEMSSMNESIESGGCVLYQAQNIIVVIGADPNL